MPRVAYLIFSHRLPDQLERLARTLRAGSPGCHVVVHHDDRGCALDRGALERAAGARFVEPVTPVDWGSFAQLQAQLRSLAWCARELSFDWLVTLSGQDYPIRPLADVERFLAAGPHDAYAEAIPVDPPRLRAMLRDRAVDEFSSRYFFRYVRLPDAAGLHRAARAAVRRTAPLLVLRGLPAGTYLGWPRRSTVFDAELRCHHGADWFMLSRLAVERVLAFAAARPDVLRHYRQGTIPSESYVNTVLACDPGVDVWGDCRRYMQWSRAGGRHPDTLGMADLPRILGSGLDFARKFDVTTDAAVLDELDRVVLGT